MDMCTPVTGPYPSHIPVFFHALLVAAALFFPLSYTFFSTSEAMLPFPSLDLGIGSCEPRTVKKKIKKKKRPCEERLGTYLHKVCRVWVTLAGSTLGN